MIKLSFEELARIIGGTVYGKSAAGQSFEGVSIDSRTIRPRELFIAFRGGRVDSHLFVPEVLRKGAAGAVVELHYPGLSAPGSDITLVAVDDSIAALKALARNYRERMNPKVVGITGSNGKTTTKEMTYALLSAVDRDVYRSAGNLNNLFGMPLAIFAMPQTTRVAVMEMGISQPGEMTRLVQIVRPDVAVITNIGATHLEFLGSLEGVARAKFEMVASSAPEMPVIINADDPVLMKEIKQYRETYITFGITHSATFEPEHIDRDNSGVVIVTIEGHRFRLPLFGEHQVYNLLAGYAVSRTLGYSFDHVDTMAIPLGTAPMRGQTVVHNGITFICDCYNANPESVRLGLKSFELLKAKGRRIIILGDMLELGSRGSEYHHDVGSQLARMPFDVAIGVGPLSKAVVDGALEAGAPSKKLYHFDTAEIAAEEVKKLLRPGDTVYIKGSRGIGLERILSEFVRTEVRA